MIAGRKELIAAAHLEGIIRAITITEGTSASTSSALIARHLSCAGSARCFSDAVEACQIPFWQFEFRTFGISLKADHKVVQSVFFIHFLDRQLTRAINI